MSKLSPHLVRLAWALPLAAGLVGCATELPTARQVVPCGAGTVTYRVQHFDTKTQMFVGFSEPYDPKLYQGIYADVEMSNGDRFPRYAFAKASNFRYFDYPLGTGNRVTVHCPGKTYVFSTEDVTEGVESDRALSRNLSDLNAGLKAQADEKRRRDNELGYSIQQGKAILAERERAANAGSAATGGTPTATTTPTSNTGASADARTQTPHNGQRAGQPTPPHATASTNASTTATTNAATGATPGTPAGSRTAATASGSKTGAGSTSSGKTAGGYLVVDTKAADQRKAFQAQEAARAQQAATDKAERDRAADAIRAKADAQQQADWERARAEMKARGSKQ